METLGRVRPDVIVHDHLFSFPELDRFLAEHYTPDKTVPDFTIHRRRPIGAGQPAPENAP
jgi:hypothetical protein